MYRNEYREQPLDFKNINEPINDYWYLGSFRKYPDMKRAYDAMEKLIGHKNFILTNGCENAMRIVMEVEKPKSLTWSKPSWGMVDVFCMMFNVENLSVPFSYEDKRFYEDYDNSSYAFYTCCGVNNYITYQPIRPLTPFVIKDITYRPLTQLNGTVANANEVYIGSFDKWLGCGLRLGFIIFPEDKYSIYHLHREQYINSAAVDAITHYTPTNKPIKNKLLYGFEPVCETHTYTTYIGECNEYGARNFTVSGQKFFRVNNGEILGY